MSSSDNSAKRIDNPFPGPQPYRVTDRARFHGREEVTRDLCDAIIANRCVALYGPSGAGKSSVMQAAVIPQLAERYDFRHVTVDGWPAGEKPVAWLMDAILSQLKIAAPREELGINESVAWMITRAFRRSDRPILIYLDQIEQLLYPGRPEVSAFLSWLDHFTERPLRGLHLVLSMREDYLGRFRDRARGFYRLLEHGFLLAPLTVGELVGAVVIAASEGRPPQEWSREAIHDVMLQVRAPGQSASKDAEIQAAFAQIVCRALFDERAELAIQGMSPSSEEPIHAEPIMEHYLESTLASLGGLQGAAEEFMENHLVAADGSRTLLTEEAARVSGLLAGDDLHVVLARLENAAILRAEVHRGSRYFELGHDWLAKKVFERKQERQSLAAEEASEREREVRQRAVDEALLSAQAEARRARRVAAIVTMFGLVAVVLGMVAWKQRADANEARRDSDRQRGVAEDSQKVAETAKSEAEAMQALAEAAQAQAERSQAENERSVRQMFEVALRPFTERTIRQRESVGVVDVDGRWTPLLARGEKTLVAATLGQHFRAVVAGHESVLSEADTSTNSLILEISVPWLLADQARRKIGIVAPLPSRDRKLRFLERSLIRLGYQVEIGALLENDDALAELGVLLLDARWISSLSVDEVAVIERFVHRGGGLFVAGHGRAWLDEGGRSQSLDAYPPNMALASLGAHWSDDEATPEEVAQREIAAVVRFENKLNKAVRLYQLNADREEYYTTLAPLESRELQTVLGRTWVYRTVGDERRLGVTLIDNENQSVRISHKVVKTPKPPVELSGTGDRTESPPPKRLSAEDMSTGLRTAKSTAKACGTKMRTLMNEATVEVTVGGDGRVKNIAVLAPAKGTKEAVCLSGELSKIRFPRSLAGGSATWTLGLY